LNKLALHKLMIVNIFALYMNEDTIIVVPVSIITGVHMLMHIEGEEIK
jgi:hypothetical protein